MSNHSTTSEGNHEQAAYLVELTKLRRRQQKAIKMRRKHKRLKVEYSVVSLLILATVINSLLFLFAENRTPIDLTIIAVSIGLWLFLKLTRYRHIEMDLSTSPQFHYVLQSIDVPDHYIRSLEQKLKHTD